MATEIRLRERRALRQTANTINAIAGAQENSSDDIAMTAARALQEIVSNAVADITAGQQNDVKALNAIANALADPNKEYVELYSVFRDYLKHEDDLINNRLNWNFTIQGFLFATYSLSLHKTADVRLALLNSAIDVMRVGQLKIFHTLIDLHVLLAALALAGMSVSTFVYLSVRAARIAVRELEKQWSKIDPSTDLCEKDKLRPWKWFLREELLGREDTSAKTHGKKPPGLPGIIGGGHQGANWLGFHAPSFLPLSIVGVWLCLFVDASWDLWHMIF